MSNLPWVTKANDPTDESPLVVVNFTAAEKPSFYTPYRFTSSPNSAALHIVAGNQIDQKTIDDPNPKQYLAGYGTIPVERKFIKLDDMVKILRNIDTFVEHIEGSDTLESLKAENAALRTTLAQYIEAFTEIEEAVYRLKQ